MSDVALVIFHIEHSNRMRIRPYEFRNRSVLEDNHFLRVVRCAPVMREQRNTRHQKTYHHSYPEFSIYHLVSPLEFGTEKRDSRPGRPFPLAEYLWRRPMTHIEPLPEERCQVGLNPARRRF